MNTNQLNEIELTLEGIARIHRAKRGWRTRRRRERQMMHAAWRLARSEGEPKSNQQDNDY